MKLLERLSGLQIIANAMPSPVFLKNRAHRLIFVNDSACDFFGYSREALLGRSDTDLFPAEQVKVFHDADNRVFNSGIAEENEEQVTDAAGRIRTVITRKRVARFRNAEFLVGIVTDVTDHRDAEASHRFLALHDALTGLPNRVLLKERIEQALALNVKKCALLYIDLDRFKEVNDTHGHPVGDELIRDFAERLKCVVRASDTVARLGGDEFAVLLVDINDLCVDDVCRRTLSAASKAFELTAVHVAVGASIGLAFAESGVDEIELQRRADVALYQAKSEGRGCSRVFTLELDESTRRRQRMAADLRVALDTGVGLEVHYQPIVGLLSGQVEGFEALARWQHPDSGLIMPDDFIPIAEVSGLITELGEWVLGRACADAAVWDPPLRLAVNVSPVQFSSGDLAAMVEQVVSRTGLNPSRLELEITEGVLIGDPVRALALLNRIRALGVQIVLDDFGTGFSSLNYFRQFPFDKVKIDRSFISDMMVNRHSRSIVEAVISLARSLSLKIVAEGVETQDQIKWLAAQGCDQAQGHFISHPLPIASFLGSVLRHASMPSRLRCPVQEQADAVRDKVVQIHRRPVPFRNELKGLARP